MNAGDVRAFVKTRLVDYKLPKLASFHAQRPREDSGKIFKQQLREPYWVGMTRRT